MFKSFKPLNDRVLVKLSDIEEISVGGIILPETAKEKTQTGIVLNIGPGKLGDNQKRVPMSVKVGDKVYFGKYIGTEIGDSYLIIHEEDILGIIELSD